MFKHSPDQAREAWVQALRSGRYRQGRGCLRDNDRFCCLGVACDLFLRMERQGKWRQDGYFVAAPGDNDIGSLPKCVRDWLGLSGCFGDLATDDIHCDDDSVSSLVALNDHADYSFAAIADVIEAGKVELA